MIGQRCSTTPLLRARRTGLPRAMRFTSRRTRVIRVAPQNVRSSIARASTDPPFGQAGIGGRRRHGQRARMQSEISPSMLRRSAKTARLADVRTFPLRYVAPPQRNQGLTWQPLSLIILTDYPSHAWPTRVNAASSSRAAITTDSSEWLPAERRRAPRRRYAHRRRPRCKLQNDLARVGARDDQARRHGSADDPRRNKPMNALHPPILLAGSTVLNGYPTSLRAEIPSPYAEQQHGKGTRASRS
jgi:hypothetical protein